MTRPLLEPLADMVEVLDNKVVFRLELAGIVADSRRVEFDFLPFSHFKFFCSFGFVFDWVCCDGCCFSPPMWFLDVDDFGFACAVVFDDFVERFGLDVEG